MPSQSVEDYIAHIYRLGGFAHTGEVAQRLGVSPASTSSMFRKMAKEGLIVHREYAGASLTAKGERLALAVIRRHRMIERFLTDMLGLPWDQVDHIAHQMEHNCPEVVIDAIEQALGEPDTCPHGHPIPNAEGVVEPAATLRLDTAIAGARVQIAAVDEDDPTLLQYLADHGLLPGTVVTVDACNDLDGTMALSVGCRQLVIGPRIARAISVREAAHQRRVS